MKCKKNHASERKKKHKLHKWVLWYPNNHFRLRMECKGWISACVVFLFLSLSLNFVAVAIRLSHAWNGFSIRSNIANRRMAKCGCISHYFIGFDHCRHRQMHTSHLIHKLMLWKQRMKVSTYLQWWHYRACCCLRWFFSHTFFECRPDVRCRGEIPWYLLLITAWYDCNRKMCALEIRPK